VGYLEARFPLASRKPACGLAVSSMGSNLQRIVANTALPGPHKLRARQRIAIPK
jgi:hypothetical protein